MTTTVCENKLQKVSIPIGSTEIVKFEYKITNTGMEPLIINWVSTSCGCTAAEYSNNPVNPFDSTTIVLEFDPNNKTGVWDKSATVHGNFEHPLNLKFEVSIV